MNWFLLIIVTAIFTLAACAIIAIIFNIIFKIADSPKVNSVISFIICLIMFIVTLTYKGGPQIDGGEFYTGTTGIIGATAVVLSFPVVNLMVSSNDGDEFFSTVGSSVSVVSTSMAISIIILCFSQTYWPLAVLLGLGVLGSALTFFRD